jgi:hypothetical protein
MGMSLGEQREDCKGFALNAPAPSLHPVNSTRRDVPKTRRDVPKPHGQQTPAAGHLIQAFPSEQHQSRIASLIGKTNRNPKRHKKILDTKALDKVYISYQSAMTTT